MGLWTAYRDIRYDAPAQDVVDSFTDPNDRFQDQLMGIEWLLCRTPGIGRPKQKDEPENNLLAVWKGNSSIGTFDVWVLYSYDDDCVTVHGIKVCNDD